MHHGLPDRRLRTTGTVFDLIHANPIPHNHLLRRTVRNGFVEVYARHFYIRRK